MKMRVVFFCGHKSPYGLAHLAPLIDSTFHLAAVIFADEKRWNSFIKSLKNDKPHKNKPFLSHIKHFIKHLISIMPNYIALFINGTFLKNINLFNKLLWNKIPLLFFNDANNEGCIEKIKELSPDLIISAAYPQIFSKQLLSIPEKGAVNFHPSLLPKFRGAHPHFWVIRNGEKESGLTAHFMTPQIDAGDIIAQNNFSIEDYSYSQLYSKIIQETPALVEKVDNFFKDCNTARPQNSENMTYFKEPEEKDKQIFWENQSAQEIKNLCRTEHAFCFFTDKKIVCLQAQIISPTEEPLSESEHPSGSILEITKNGIIVKSKGSRVLIGAIKEGGKTVPSQDWASKYEIKEGFQLK